MAADLLLDPDLRSRVGRIVCLLDHWSDFYETGARDDGPSGDGGVYLLPGMSRHPSVVELARALESLWRFAPGCSAHLFGYYGAPFRNVDRRRRVKSKGKFHVVEERVRARVLPSWVVEKRVVAGVRFVAQEPRSEAEAVLRPWCFRGDPSVPSPIMSRKGEVYDGDSEVAA